MNNSLNDYMEYRSKLLLNVIFPIEIGGGILLNIIAFFLWTFGSKSRNLCCATYFAANSLFDLLSLSINGLWTVICFTDFNTNCYYSDVACKVHYYMYSVFLQSSNWISTTITVERAMTIMFPLKFRSQDMRQHSKYAIAIIVVLVLSGNIPSFYAFVQLTETTYCTYNKLFDNFLYGIIEESVRSFIPFIVILICNCCTVASLCKQRRNSVSPNHERYINVFTKVTILTGLSFIVSNSVDFFCTNWDLFGLHHYFPELNPNVFFLLIDLKSILIYFNCLMNPIICFMVCKSMSDDIKTFSQRVLRVFCCGQ